MSATKKDRSTPVKRDVCGTSAGYQRHSRRGEYPCDSCLKGQADYMRDWRHASGQSQGRYLTAMEIGHLTGKLGDFW